MSENEAMTEQELVEIETRASTATPGPWHIETTRRKGGHNYHIRTDSGQYIIQGNQVPTEMDAYLLAAARADVPRLVAEIRRLKAGRP